MVAAGCSSGSPSPSQPNSTAAASVAPSAAVSGAGTAGGQATLASYYAQRLSWEDCRDRFSCATLRVPLDYRRPAAGDIEVALIRLPASGRRLGSLVVNPGGPGASGLDYARDLSSLSPQVRERFDTVGFDPRGVGRSTPVDCVGDRELDQLLEAPAAPRNAKETAAAVESAQRLADGCRTRSALINPRADRPVDLLGLG